MHHRSKAPLERLFANVAVSMWRPPGFGGNFGARKELQPCDFPLVCFLNSTSLFPLSLYRVPLSLSLCLVPLLFNTVAPSAQIRLMAGGSSAPAPDPLSADGLPLIICTECRLSRVVRRRSQQPWSEGQILYCCPRHNVRISLSSV